MSPLKMTLLCPCRVWFALEWKSIEYDTMLIDLRRKPSWFTELSPAGVVPVAKIKDQLVPESYEILKVSPLQCAHAFVRAVKAL